MRCPKCGKTGQEGEVFCGDDGTKLVVDQLVADYAKHTQRKSLPPLEESEEINFIYKIMRFLGFTSGMGLVWVGGVCFIFAFVGHFLSASPESAIQQVVKGQNVQNAYYTIIIIALGIIIMTLKKVGGDIVKKLDTFLDKKSQPNE
jgi:hypothetical protein